MSSQPVELPPAIQGPDNHMLAKLPDIVREAISSGAMAARAAANSEDTTGGPSSIVAAVLDRLLQATAPPFMEKLTVLGANGSYTFANTIRKDSMHLPSLYAAITAFEAARESSVTVDGDDGGSSHATTVEGAARCNHSGYVCVTLLPFIAMAASQYSALFGDGSPLTLHELSASLPPDSPLRVTTLTKAQALSLVACSFLCLFPRIGYQGQAVVPCAVIDSDAEDEAGEGQEAKSKEQPSLSVCSLPTVNCDELFAAPVQGVEVAKLHMILIYFSEMQSRFVKGFAIPKGMARAYAADHSGPSLIFLRYHLPKGGYFFNSSEKKDKTESTTTGTTSAKPLLPLVMAPLKESIDDQHEVLRVDFANMTIGGGAMSYGCVQEEITFALCPELIASRVMHCDMGEREAILLLGAEQFALLQKGTYGFGMACEGPVPHPDEMFVSSASSSIIAIDALDFRGGRRGRESQYRMKSLTREMVKFAAGIAVPHVGAYCASLVAHKRTLLDESIMVNSSPGDKSIVATGNWGCGVFLGDVEVKSLLQWLVCSEVGKSMHYYPFDAKRLLVLEPLADQLCAKQVTTAMLYDFLSTLPKRRRDDNITSVFVALIDHFGLVPPPKADTPVAEDGTDTELDDGEATPSYDGEGGGGMSPGTTNR